MSLVILYVDSWLFWVLKIEFRKKAMDFLVLVIIFFFNFITGISSSLHLLFCSSVAFHNIWYFLLCVKF